ncbi:MAG TPA: hypothetical protein VJH94_02300 [Candidatus Paceibacterota bacterium]
MQTNYKSRPVRSPFQPHPVKQAQERAMNTQDEGNPIRLMLQKLCQPNLNLCASFSPDIGVMSALNKTPGLIAVKCELSMDGRPLGIGHGSTAVSRLNKGLDRALYSCLNGSLMSAINSACKSLDVIRLEGTQEQLGEAYRAPQGEENQQITDKQQAYLRELILATCEDDTDRQERINALSELTKEEASAQIKMLAGAR